MNMSFMSVTFFVTAIAVVFAMILCLFLFMRERKRSEKVLLNIDAMLQTAINGDFTDQIFDESLLSSVETRFAAYLSSSEVSAKNLATEKDKIKELLSDISHQTKTPIANILLYAELLSEKELPEDSRKLVLELKNQSEKLKFLVDALIKTSRLETGIIALKPEKQKVCGMLSEIRKQALPEAEEKGITIYMEETEAEAVFDRKWTTEAIYNILDNAVKYTGENGKIHIAAAAYELFLRIDIADTGCGIEEEEIPLIFKRFYRSPGVHDSKGSGIGLYLARQIINGEGGYIRVTSKAGCGSTFSVFLTRQ